MRRQTSFKGYVTETAYDERSGTFVSNSVRHVFAADPKSSAATEAQITVLKQRNRSSTKPKVTRTDEDAA